jgi:hypothetical protein
MKTRVPDESVILKICFLQNFVHKCVRKAEKLKCDEKPRVTDELVIFKYRNLRLCFLTGD